MVPAGDRIIIRGLGVRVSPLPLTATRSGEAGPSGARWQRSWRARLLPFTAPTDRQTPSFRHQLVSSQRRLFLPKGDHGIETRRAQCRHDAGKKSGPDQDNRDGKPGERIQRRHFKKESPHELAQS